LITRDDALTAAFDDAESEPPLAPLTPGEVLVEEFMKPLGLTSRALAEELGVPGNRIFSLLNGNQSITAETALALARRFGTSAELWMNLQSAYDLATARKNESAGRAVVG
jgi:addiction module HigA family antidote